MVKHTECRLAGWVQNSALSHKTRVTFRQMTEHYYASVSSFVKCGWRRACNHSTCFWDRVRITRVKR